MKIVKHKLNVALGGYPEGQILNLRCDSDGVPLDPFWRKRLKESARDNCIEVVTEKKSTTKKSKPKKDTAAEPVAQEQSESTMSEDTSHDNN